MPNIKSRSVSPVAERFAKLVESSDYSRNEISEKIGFPNANNVTMIKQGLTKIPVIRIPKIARTFNIDAAELFKQVMGEYEPDKLKAITECLGEPVTKFERRLLSAVYEIISPDDLKVRNKDYCELIKSALLADK